MTSSILSLSFGTPEKTDGTIINPHGHKSPYDRCNQTKNSKLANCRNTAKKCFGEKVRPTAGLCMIAFAVPLIVPGITLTVVAFEDQAGFSKYSALHIFGMVLLGAAILLMTSGILLNTRIKFRIAPDATTSRTSVHEKSAKEDNLDVVIISSTNDYPKKINAFVTAIAPSSPYFSHLVLTEDTTVEGTRKQHHTTADVDMFSDTGQRHVSFPTRKCSKGHNSRKSFEDYSSSFDSFDSEDVSSGSYILSENVGGEVPAQEEKSRTGFFKEIGELRSFSTFKPGNMKKSVFSFEGFKYPDDLTAETNSNMSSLAGDKPKSNTTDTPNDRIQSRHESTQDNLELERSRYDELPTQIPEDFKTSSDSVYDIQVEESSPGSRQRLHGLSSNVLMTSTELLLGSCDSLKPHDVVSEENMSFSNSSVFSLDQVLKSKEDVLNDDSTKEAFLAKNSTSNPTKTWAQSPPTARPHSFPIGSCTSGSSDVILKKNSLNEMPITRLQSPQNR